MCTSLTSHGGPHLEAGDGRWPRSGTRASQERGHGRGQCAEGTGPGWGGAAAPGRTAVGETRLPGFGSGAGGCWRRGRRTSPAVLAGPTGLDRGRGHMVPARAPRPPGREGPSRFRKVHRSADPVHGHTVAPALHVSAGPAPTQRAGRAPASATRRDGVSVPRRSTRHGPRRPLGGHSSVSQTARRKR